jgi:hypothetical protein
VYETLGRARIAQFFDALIEYPDSRPALADVRACLAATSLHGHFIASFGAAVRQRLLHAGATPLLPRAAAPCSLHHLPMTLLGPLEEHLVLFCPLPADIIARTCCATSIAPALALP